MRKQMLTPAISMLLVSLGTLMAAAQGHAQYAGEAYYGTTSLCVTATAGRDHIRFASLEISQRIRLEILNQAGNIVFDSNFHDGNLLDWPLEDSYGNRLPDDVYGCLVTVEDMTGRLSHRRSVLTVKDGVPRFETSRTERAEISNSSEEQETMTILREDEDLPMVQLLHDGESGRIVSGKGGLSFRAGNALSGRDVEYMHMTAEGKVGIGVVEPQAKFDVDGVIRASEGFQFADGTILKMERGFPVVVTSGSNGVERGLAGSGSQTVRALTAGGGIVPLLADGSPGRVAASEGGPPYWNVFYGANAGSALTNGNYNSFFGADAGLSTTTGTGNSFFGSSAGRNNDWGSSNSFFGGGAGNDNTRGWRNSFFGSGAGGRNTTAADNSYFGESAGYLNTTGTKNSFFGGWAGYYNKSDFNSFFGYAAGTGCCNATGSGDSFFGYFAGWPNTTGVDNSFFGREAGASNTAENNNTLIGAYSDGAAGASNGTAVGYRAKVTQSNSLILGSISGVNGSTADTKVGIGTTSPDRKLQIASSPGMNAELHIGGAGDETRDVYSGMGPDLTNGPALNFGYSGYSFGRSSGFINVRPDPSAVAPNPSLRFMTANQQRMIITNTGDVGIGTVEPKSKVHAEGGAIYIGSPGEGIILKSPSGLMCVKLTVDDAGGLVTTPLACP
jgi:hypothetical protein